MVGRPRKGEIDGFCVGEPWSRRAAASKLGRLVADSSELLPGLGEKVLAVRSDWHRSHSLEHTKIIRALSQASAWLANPSNFDQAVEIISSERYVNRSNTVVAGALFDAAARLLAEGKGAIARVHGSETNGPSQIHANWYLDQMLCWGNVYVTLARSLDISKICMEGFYQSVTSARIPQLPLH